MLVKIPRMKTCLSIILYLFAFSSSVPGQHTDTTQLSLGKSQYQELARQSSLPRYGPCWLAALANLQSTCAQLSDMTQARLALSFANCFLAQSGQQVYPCDPEEDIADCLEMVDNNAFTAYSNFFTHTQNMCYFLQSQTWQELTDTTIHKLSSSSATVAKEMENSLHLQQEIAIGQQSSLEYQRQLAENGSYLRQAIEASKGNVRDMLEEFRSSTSEQKMLIFEVFDRVATLQNLVVSEVSWLYTVVFYSACLLVIYLVTATKRTADSRLWLFFILTANFGLERLVIYWSLPGEGENIVMDLSQVVSQRIWLVRNMAIFISIVVLTVMAVMFKDYNLLNNSLLEEIIRQNLDLKKSMETFQVSNKTKFISQNTSLNNMDTLDSHFPPLSDMLAEDTGFNGDEEDFSDTDSGSFNSSLNDRTFDPHSMDLSDNQCGTAATSRETTPTNQVIDTIVMKATSSSLASSTPSKGINTATKQIIRQMTTQSPATSRYNLRNRNRSGSTVNSNLDETPVTFAKLVKKQLGRSKRNYSKWKIAVGRQKDENSDDETE